MKEVYLLSVSLMLICTASTCEVEGNLFILT